MAVHPCFEGFDALIQRSALTQAVSHDLQAIWFYNRVSNWIAKHPASKLSAWFSTRHPENSVPIENRCVNIGGRARSDAEEKAYRSGRAFMHAWSQTDDALRPIHIYQANALFQDIPSSNLSKVFCDEQNTITSSVDGFVRYRAAQPEAVEDLIEQLCYWLAAPCPENVSQRDAAILKACLAQLGLNLIHPFKDGNGRTSRAMTTALLIRCGIDLQIPALELYYAWDRRAYEQAYMTQACFDQDLNLETSFLWLTRMIQQTKCACILHLQASVGIGVQDALYAMKPRAKRPAKWLADR